MTFTCCAIIYYKYFKVFISAFKYRVYASFQNNRIIICNNDYTDFMCDSSNPLPQYRNFTLSTCRIPK